MGITGSDVTKDAAAMVLLNDEFASIIDGIREGRKIFDNLKKPVLYMMSTNIIESIPFLGSIILAFPVPISSIFMLLFSVITDMLPAISLAYEDADPDIMTRKPRSKNDHLVKVQILYNAYML